MSRLILPGHRPPNGAPTIFVPEGYENEPQRIVGVCNVCGEEFPEAGQEQAWQEHVGLCARRNRDRIERELEKRRKSVFNEDNWDPEVAAHMREVGERMIEEGRLEVKPNERAGF